MRFEPKHIFSFVSMTKIRFGYIGPQYFKTLQLESLLQGHFLTGSSLVYHDYTHGIPAKRRQSQKRYLEVTVLGYCLELGDIRNRIAGNRYSLFVFLMGPKTLISAILVTRGISGHFRCFFQFSIFSIFKMSQLFQFSIFLMI